MSYNSRRQRLQHCYGWLEKHQKDRHEVPDDLVVRSVRTENLNRRSGLRLRSFGDLWLQVRAFDYVLVAALPQFWLPEQIDSDSECRCASRHVVGSRTMQTHLDDYN